MIYAPGINHREEDPAERIRRANAIVAQLAAHKPTGAESAPEVRNASVSEPADTSAPVVLPADTVEALADAFGVAAVAIHDGILSASLPTIDGRTVKVCTAEVRPCRHTVRNATGACVMCGQREGAA